MDVGDCWWRMSQSRPDAILSINLPSIHPLIHPSIPFLKHCIGPRHRSGSGCFYTCK